MNMHNAHKILLIEDNLADAHMVQEAVRETDANRVQLAHCASLTDAVRHLGRESVDIVIVDLELPDASGLEALAELDRVSPRTPVIVLTDMDDDTTALEALRHGAQDLLLKGQISGDILLRSARYALERQRTVNLQSDLLRGIARQLKSPVDALMASIQVLHGTDNAKLTERQARMLERVLNTAETLRRFHDGMLDLARADEGPSRAEISGLGGACAIEEIKRRMAKELEAIEGEGAAPAHAFVRSSLASEPPAPDNPPLRALLLEDNPGDARLVHEILADSSLNIELANSVCLTDSVRRLETEHYDLLLVDLGLPDADATALEAVSEVARLAPRSCIIVLTGRDDDASAMESLKKGAQDYLIKGQVDTAVLARSIRFARERQRTVNLRAELLEAIAHELRNPIHVTLGYAHLMLEKVPDPLTPEQAHALGNVLATARTLRRLSDAMFDLAGAEKGPLREELRNAGAGEVIDEIKRRMTHLLAVDRDPGQNLFAARVDRAKPAGAGRLFRRALRRSGKQPKQVLVIDPDYDSRTIIRAALESGAFQVVESCKESEVLDHLVSEKIALAVFERRTPDLAAPEIFEHLRKVAAYCDIPMLLLDTDDRSGRPSPEHRISKPFTPEQLLFAVDHVLGRA